MNTSSLGRYVEGFRVHNHGQVLEADFLAYSWGDMILLQDGDFVHPTGKFKNRPCIAGSILRSNKDRSRRTQDKNWTTHDVFRDLYEAFRGSRHAVTNYGAQGIERYTEDSEIEDTIQALHEYTLWLMTHGPLFAHVQADLNVGMGELAKSYQYKIDDHKKRAQGLMWRGIMDTDSLGRRNPGAQRFAMYGAGTELRQRQDAMQWLSMHMDHKTVRCFRLINEHMELINELWQTLCTRSAVNQLLSSQTIGSSYAKVHDLYLRCSAIRAAPFRGFAVHTTRDLMELKFSLEKQPGEEQVRSILDRLREGVRLAFVLDTLQMEIILPLSELLARLDRKERARRKRAKDRTKKRFTHSMAPEEFDLILSKLFAKKPRNTNEPDNSFEARLNKVKDANISKPKKARIVHLLAGVKRDVIEDDMLKVKDDLVYLARQI